MSNQHHLPRRPTADSAGAPGNVAELPLDSVGDATLVAALLKGNERAAGIIWQRYAQTVRRALKRSLGPDQEAEDLLHDVFIEFVKSASKLDQLLNLRSYLISIAYRRAGMEIRKRKVRRLVSLTATGNVPDVPSRHGNQDEVRALRALYTILDTLSTRDRLVFVARHVEGMQLDETAEALGISQATAWRVGKATFQRVMAKAQRDPALAAYVELWLKGQST
jgi:RNA polymerase sigma-70 factor (ECF subfamily)